jgi:hypothetical protein
VVGLAAFILAIGHGLYAAQPDPIMRGAGPADPPPGYRGPALSLAGPSIVKGKPPGIEVGQYPPDFKLQPVQPYADLKQWLGDKAPQKADDLVPLSEFVGKAPILLLFGSYT